MTKPFQVLTDEQAQHFIEKGYVTVKGCLDRDLAKRWTDEAYGRLGYDPNDRSTWTKDIVWMDRNHVAPIRELSPKAWGALCDVCGGEDRIETKIMEIESEHFTTINATEWSDAFIVNFRRGADKPWMPALTRSRRLAQGRQLLPPLPRQPRAGAADHRLLVRRRPQGRRHLHRAGLDRAWWPAISPTIPKASIRAPISAR